MLLISFLKGSYSWKTNLRITADIGHLLKDDAQVQRFKLFIINRERKILFRQDRTNKKCIILFHYLLILLKSCGLMGKKHGLVGAWCVWIGVIQIQLNWINGQHNTLHSYKTASTNNWQFIMQLMFFFSYNRHRMKIVRNQLLFTQNMASPVK